MLVMAPGQIVYTSAASLQAPNWTKDGKALIYNSNGAMYRFDMDEENTITD